MIESDHAWGQFFNISIKFIEGKITNSELQQVNLQNFLIDLDFESYNAKLYALKNANQICDFLIKLVYYDKQIMEQAKLKHFVQSYKFLQQNNFFKSVKDESKLLKINLINAHLTNNYQYLKDIDLKNMELLVGIVFSLIWIDYKQLSVFFKRFDDKEQNKHICQIKSASNPDNDYEKLVLLGQSLKRICAWKKTIDLYEELLQFNIQSYYNVYIYFTLCKLKFVIGKFKEALQNCQLALDELQSNQPYYKNPANRLIKLELLFIKLLLVYISRDNTQKNRLIDRIIEELQENECQKLDQIERISLLFYKFLLLVYISRDNTQKNRQIDRIMQELKEIKCQKLDQIKSKSLLLYKYLLLVYTSRDNTQKNRLIDRILKELQENQCQKLDQIKIKSLLFCKFAKRISRYDVSSISYATKTFDAIQIFLQNQIYYKNIMPSIQTCLELYIIVQFLKYKKYKVIKYLTSQYRTIFLKMITLKELQIDFAIIAQVYYYFGEYDTYLKLALKLNNQKLIAEAYFAQMNESKAIEYYEKVDDSDSHFQLGYLYFNKSNEQGDRELRKQYLDTAFNYFQRLKLDAKYTIMIRKIVSKIKFQLKLDQILQETQQLQINQSENNQQYQESIFEQEYFDDIREDILIFYKFVKYELVPYYKELDPAIEKFIKQTRRYSVNSTELNQHIQILGVISYGKVNKIMYQNKLYACKSSQFIFNPIISQDDDQQLKDLCSRINEINVLTDLLENELPYVIQNQHIGVRFIWQNDHRPISIELFNLTPIYKPYLILCELQDDEKLQFGQKLAICLKQLEIYSIQHSGINPENILVDDKGDPVITGFSQSSTNFEKMQLNSVHSYGLLLLDLYARTNSPSHEQRNQREQIENKIPKPPYRELQMKYSQNIKSNIEKLIIKCTQQILNEQFTLSQVLFQFLLMKPCRDNLLTQFEDFMNQFKDVDITEQEYQLICEFQEISEQLPSMDPTKIHYGLQSKDNLYKCQYQDQYQQQKLLLQKYQIITQNKQQAFRQILQCMRSIRNQVYLNEKTLLNITEFYNYRIILLNNGQKIQFEVFSLDNNYQFDQIKSPQQLLSLLRTVEHINEEGIIMTSKELECLLFDNNPVIFNFLYCKRQQDDMNKNQYGWPLDLELDGSNQLKQIKKYFKHIIVQNQNEEIKGLIFNILILFDQFFSISCLIKHLVNQFVDDQETTEYCGRYDINHFLQFIQKVFKLSPDEDIIKFANYVKGFQIKSSELNGNMQVEKEPIGTGGQANVNKVVFQGKQYASRMTTISFQKNDGKEDQFKLLKARIDEINLNCEMQDYGIPYVLQNQHLGFRYQYTRGLQRVYIYTLTPIYQPFSLIKDTKDLKLKIQFAEKVAIALKQLQTREISHQDIKPDNILVDDQFNPVIIDFGISIAGLKTQISQDIQCTKKYADPQLVFNKLMSKKNDVYSFGVTLYKLFTCSEPQLVEESKEFSLNEIHQQNILRIKNPQIKQLITKCVQLQLKERFSFCQVLYNFLMMNQCRQDVMEILKLFMKHFDDVDITEKQYLLIKEFQEISLLNPELELLKIEQVIQISDNLYKCQYQDTQLLLIYYYSVQLKYKQVAFRQILNFMRFLKDLLNYSQRGMINFTISISEQEQENFVNFQIFFLIDEIFNLKSQIITLEKTKTLLGLIDLFKIAQQKSFQLIRTKYNKDLLFIQLHFKDIQNYIERCSEITQEDKLFKLILNQILSEFKDQTYVQEFQIPFKNWRSK